MPEVLTIHEAASFLRLSCKTIRRLVSEGKLPVSALSHGKFLFLREDLERALRPNAERQPSGVSTTLAALKLNISYWDALDLIRLGKINPPAKDAGGDYVWAEADLAAAREVLNGKRKDRKAALAR